jgi:hypothetical protein
MGFSWDPKGVQRGSVCVDCCKGKLVQTFFPGTHVKANEKMKVVYADLWGPAQSSLGGNRYALLLIDECTSYTWEYFLKQKSQAADYIKHFVLRREREGHAMQCLRTDKGGEFSEETFKQWLWDKGIRLQQSPPYTPQLQGVVERMNRTLGDMARTIRVSAGLDKEFWVLAWSTAVYLRNRAPASAHGGKTPYELYFEKIPNLSTLRVFGCRAEALIPAETRRKDDLRSVSGMFVGYDEDSRAYKFLPDGSRKWKSVRSLKFDELRFGRTYDNASEDFDVISGVSQVDNNNSEECEQAESKENQRPVIEAVKATGGVRTRLQIERGLKERQGDVAYVCVDDMGAEVSDPRAMIKFDVPKSLEDALTGEESDKWRQAVDDELQSMEDAKVWGPPVQLPLNKRVTPLKFLFTKKIGPDGRVSRYKARLVFLHREPTVGESAHNGVESVYAPVVERASMRVFLALVAWKGWSLTQADVQTAFLNAVNEGEDYVSLPSLVSTKGSRVRLLYKAIYGLKRAPKMWSQTFTKWATGEGDYFAVSSEPCMFLRHDRTGGLIVYVDDLLLAAENEGILHDMINAMERAFKLRVLGKPDYFLGMNINYDETKGVIKLWQETYIMELVRRFGGDVLLPRTLPMVPEIELSKLQGELQPTDEPYSSLVGGLLFLSTSTRPDISFAVHRLTRFISNPAKQHWDAALNVLGYLKRTATYGIVLGKVNGEMFLSDKIVGFSDSDWASDVDDRISVLGGVVLWGGSIVSWFARKQTMVATSTAEAETLAAVEVAYLVMALKELVSEILGFNEQQVCTVIYMDNQPALDAILQGKGRGKHYSTKTKFLAQCVNLEKFAFQKIASERNLADIFTKSLRKVRFMQLLSGLMQIHQANFP